MDRITGKITQHLSGTLRGMGIKYAGIRMIVFMKSSK